MLRVWSEINSHNHSNPSNEIIWNNKNIIINSKSILNQQLFSHNIVYIADIFNDNGEIKNWEDLQQLGCTRVHLLQWQGLISAIPSVWRKSKPICIRPEPPITIKITIIPLTGCKTHLIRKFISSRCFSPPISKMFFEHMFDIHEDE